MTHAGIESGDGLDEAGAVIRWSTLALAASHVYRWYEPGTGRYSSPDPMQVGVGGEVNQYQYARGNPLLFIDPRGLWPFGSGAGFSIGCAYVMAQALTPSFPPGTNDKFKHCVVSCKIQITCGPIGAAAAGVGKEILDVFGPGDADFGDAIADLDGIVCGFKSRRDPQCSNCDSCCEGTKGGGW